MWNRLLDATYPGLASLQASVSAVTDYPAFRVHENDDGMVLTTEIPGVLSEDIGVELKSDTLIVSIEKKPETVAEGARRLRRERQVGRFSRSIELPFHADASGVSAEYSNGVLIITVPRAEEEKSRRITVHAG